jgi:phage-related protein
VRKILTYGGYFEAFLATLNQQEVKKVDYLLALLATSDRVPTKFVKHLRDGLYELRIKAADSIYRVFFIFDHGNIVVLFNGIKKKSQKTPKKEIEKALKIKEEYYADKQS